MVKGLSDTIWNAIVSKNGGKKLGLSIFKVDSMLSQAGNNIFDYLTSGSREECDDLGMYFV